MLEAALIALRWVQFWAAMILFGSSLFLLYALPPEGIGSGPQRGWSGRLLAVAAAALLAAGLLALIAQTAILAGSLGDGIKPDSLWAAITTTAFGPSAIVRATAAATALAVLLSQRSSRAVLAGSAILGALATASIAWMGHGASTDGAPGLVHLTSDMLHVLAAGVWIGALVLFLCLLWAPPRTPEEARIVHRALRGFGGIGSAAVAVIIASGLFNSWFLVGPDHLEGLLATIWGQLLVAKLVLFVAMLGFAGLNRFRLTPRLEAALGRDPDAAISALRRSLVLETGTALIVLFLVAMLGIQPPPAAS